MPRLDHPGARLDSWSPVQLSALPIGVEPRLTPAQAWSALRLSPWAPDLALHRVSFGVGYVPGSALYFDGGFQGLGGPPGRIMRVVLTTGPEILFCEHGTATDYLVIDDATGAFMGGGSTFKGP